MKFCAHYHQAQYCSRSCQRQAWKSSTSDPSHHELCDRLHCFPAESGVSTRIAPLRGIEDICKDKTLADIEWLEERRHGFRELLRQMQSVTNLELAQTCEWSLLLRHIRRGLITTLLFRFSFGAGLDGRNLYPTSWPTNLGLHAS